MSTYEWAIFVGDEQMPQGGECDDLEKACRDAERFAEEYESAEIVVFEKTVLMKWRTELLKVSPATLVTARLSNGS